jgi:hypothetical protein
MIKLKKILIEKKEGSTFPCPYILVHDSSKKKELNIYQLFKSNPRSFKCFKSIKFNLIFANRASIEQRFFLTLRDPLVYD